MLRDNLDWCQRKDCVNHSDCVLNGEDSMMCLACQREMDKLEVCLSEGASTTGCETYCDDKLIRDLMPDPNMECGCDGLEDNTDFSTFCELFSDHCGDADIRQECQYT